MNTATVDSTERSRLYWQCRRGMLELDLLLRGFLDREGEDLDGDAQRVFEKLLDYPDAVLLELLLGRMQASDREVAELVRRIRAAAAD